VAKQKRNQAAGEQSPNPETDSSQDQEQASEASISSESSEAEASLADASEETKPPDESVPASELPPVTETVRKQLPTLGRIVHYALNESDVQDISVHHVIGPCQPLSVGMLVAAIVIREEAETPHLMLLIDGDLRKSPRACKRAEGTEPGTWRWPARV
jgi:hypothetical protein